MKNVDIIERKSGRKIATYPVTLSGTNYVPGDDEYIDEAWDCAIADKLVDPSRKADYSFSIREAPLRL